MIVQIITNCVSACVCVCVCARVRVRVRLRARAHAHAYACGICKTEGTDASEKKN